MTIDYRSSTVANSVPSQTGITSAKISVQRLKKLAQETAAELDNDREIYYFYAVFDSLSSTYSNFKLGFDLCAIDNSTNAMHDYMLTPEAIILITLEATFLVGYSLVACEFESKDGTYPDPKSQPLMPLFRKELKRFSEFLMPFFKYLFKHVFGYSDLPENIVKEKVNASWPLFREIMKGFKNAYKGWRSTILALGLLVAYNTAPFILPAGIVLGVLAAANRYWLRVIVDRRKEMMKINEISLHKIKIGKPITEAERQLFFDPDASNNNESQLNEDNQASTVSLAEIKYQTQRERYYSFGGVAFNGFIDGMYLYVGVLSIGVLAPQVFFSMSILCGVYALACVITRVYEEYDFQTRLHVTQAKCRLHLIIKTLENYSPILKILKAHQDIEDNELLSKDILSKEEIVTMLIEAFDTERNTLKKLITRNYLEAFFIGIKNGLFTYSALTSFVFLVGIVLMLTSTPFPPLLLIMTVPMGIVFIVGCIIDAIFMHHNFINTSKPETASLCAQYQQHQHYIQNASPEERSLYFIQDKFLAAFQAGASVDIPSYSYYSERMEIIRSFWSGFAKGYKFIGFAGNAFQEIDEQGNYHDSKGMQAFSAVGSLVFAGVLAYRALAKGLAKPPLGLSGSGLFGSDDNNANNAKPVEQKNNLKYGNGFCRFGLFSNPSTEDGSNTTNVSSPSSDNANRSSCCIM